MCKTSIQIKPEALIEMCNRALNTIQDERQERLEKAIENLMSKRFFPSKCRDDAIERLKAAEDTMGLSMYEDIMELTFSGYESSFKTLRSLSETAKLNYSLVTLCAEDHAKLRNFL